MSGIVPKPICWSFEEILSILKKSTNFLIFSRQKSAKNACMIKSSCLQMFCKNTCSWKLRSPKNTYVGASFYTKFQVLQRYQNWDTDKCVDICWLNMTNSVWYLVSAIFWHEKVRQFMNFDCGYVSSILYLFITVTNVCNGHQYLINIPQQSKHYWEKEIFESKSVNIYLNLPYTFSPVLSSFFCQSRPHFVWKASFCCSKLDFQFIIHWILMKGNEMKKKTIQWWFFSNQKEKHRLDC